MTTQIIIKKLHEAVDVPHGTLTFGDARDQMAKDLLDTLTDVINRKSDHPTPYYILVHAKIDPANPSGHMIKERVILMDHVPRERYIGTMLFRIDNKHADAEMVWNLPLDIPGLPFEGERGKIHRVQGAVSIPESAIGMPIFNRRLH